MLGSSFFKNSEFGSLLQDRRANYVKLSLRIGDSPEVGPESFQMPYEADK
jgi:hypothetical protein